MTYDDTGGWLWTLKRGFIMAVRGNEVIKTRSAENCDMSTLTPAGFTSSYNILILSIENVIVSIF